MKLLKEMLFTEEWPRKNILHPNRVNTLYWRSSLGVVLHGDMLKPDESYYSHTFAQDAAVEISIITGMPSCFRNIIADFAILTPEYYRNYDLLSESLPPINTHLLFNQIIDAGDDIELAIKLFKL